jgi:hypothetical protein
VVTGGRDGWWRWQLVTGRGKWLPVGKRISLAIPAMPKAAAVRIAELVFAEKQGGLCERSRVLTLPG